MTTRRKRVRASRLAVAVLPLLLAACGQPDLVFESHLMHDHGDEHGMPTMQHSADVQAGEGELRIAGRIPVGLCPAVVGKVELEGQRLSLHVDTRPPVASRGERCDSPHPVAMAEYTATIQGLRPGEYMLVVHHDAMSVTRYRYDPTRTRARYSKAEVVEMSVRVR
jgi:hypothetical protein